MKRAPLTYARPRWSKEQLARIREIERDFHVRAFGEELADWPLGHKLSAETDPAPLELYTGQGSTPQYWIWATERSSSAVVVPKPKNSR